MTGRPERHGQCHKCELQRQVYCVNEPPLAADLLLCGECWMVRAFNDGLALNDARRERDELFLKLNTPELHDFAKAVVLEAAHQRERWGAEHDAGKTPADWFWLIGYLAGKALHRAVLGEGDPDKCLHHIITTAAVCANWHAAMMGTDNRMRPGIDPVARGIEPANEPNTAPAAQKESL